jgi:hypothetical protein
VSLNSIRFESSSTRKRTQGFVRDRGVSPPDARRGTPELSVAHHQPGTRCAPILESEARNFVGLLAGREITTSNPGQDADRELLACLAIVVSEGKFRVLVDADDRGNFDVKTGLLPDLMDAQPARVSPNSMTLRGEPSSRCRRRWSRIWPTVNDDGRCRRDERVRGRCAVGSS